MSSILTNTSAMVALQTLKGINGNLAKTQEEISTGKSVSGAKDNAAVWSISKIMESDVAGLSTISDSLELGTSTVAVASEGAETITDLLTQMKKKIVSAQEANVDREKIQTDIDALREQIASVVGAAQFNGLNLLKGTQEMTVLSSIDRHSDGTVTSSYINVARQDLSSSQGSLSTSGDALASNVTVSSTTLAAAETVNVDTDGDPATITFGGDLSADTLTFSIGGNNVSFAAGDLSATAATAAATIAEKINAAQIDGITASVVAGALTFASSRNFDTTAITVTQGGSGGTLSQTSLTLEQRAESYTFGKVGVKEGDGYQLALSNGNTATYVATAGDTMEDVAKGLKVALDSFGDEDILTNVTTNDDGEWVLEIANTGTANVTVALAARTNGSGDAVITGGLAGIDGVDVTTDEGAKAALANIETFIQTATKAAAALGSSHSRIETQNDFVSNLIDSMKTGIGSLVDADMEEASARLQALQTQQQLGIQALSIANQQPQTILSLFQ